MMPTRNRFSFVEMVRVALISGVMGAGVVAIIFSLDPLGSQTSRADEAARRAVGIHLCVSIDVYENRLGQLRANQKKGPLTRNEQDVLDALGAGYVELKHAEAILGTTCTKEMTQ